MKPKAENTPIAHLVIAAVLIMLFPALVQAGTWLPFGPKSYIRGTGAPVTVTDTFTLLNPATQYTLKAFNGGLQDNQTEFVSSSVVTLNGVQILGPNNFNQNVAEVTIPIGPQAANTLTVQVRGQPGGVLTIEIIGVDNDPPVITETAGAPPNATGWYNSPVTVNFACSDRTSGVAFCPTPVTVTTEGASQVVSGTAMDLAANTATASTAINLDETPPFISASVNPPPDASGYNSTAVTVTFNCSDNLSGVAVCPAPLTVATEGTTTITGTGIDVAGNVGSFPVTVNISYKYFKIRGWQTNPSGDPLQTGKCLDYGISPTGSAGIFLNDCSAANPIRVYELSPYPPPPASRPGTLCASPRMGTGGIPLCHEVMLFAGNSVIGVGNPQTLAGATTTSGTQTTTLDGTTTASGTQAITLGGTTTTTEYQLELQCPFTSIRCLGISNPASQIFRLDGDSIILEGNYVDPATNMVVPGPCINTVNTVPNTMNTSVPPLCPNPTPQLVIQVENARGANGSPIVATVRNLSDNEFWDFVPLPGSSSYPTTGFVSATLNYDLWNKTCASPQVPSGGGPPPVDSSGQPALCATSAVGWGSVIVVTSPNNDCRVTETDQITDIGACMDMTGFAPLVLTAGVTIRGDRRGIHPGPQLYAQYPKSFNAPTIDCDLTCLLDVQGDYVRITGLHLRGQSRFAGADSNVFSKNDGIYINSAGVFPGFPTAPILASVTELIATIDHNEISDWIGGAIRAISPFGVSTSKECTYPMFADSSGGSWYPCDASNQLVPFQNAPAGCSCGVSVLNDPGTLANVRVARNFLHHNSSSSTGYGVEMGNQGGRFLAVGNTFSWNRHDLTGSGEPHSEYHALNNLVLSGAPDYGPFLGRLQDFDMHGTDNATTFVGGAGGYYVEIDGNTFLGFDGHDYVLRGYPDNYPSLSNYTRYYGNVSLRNGNDAIKFVDCTTTIGCYYDFNSYPSKFPINIFSNSQFADSSPPYTDPTARLGVGDFDGDGDDDLFLATGAGWYYSAGGKREWRYLNSAPDTIGQLLLGDFDGDGRSDVVALRNGQLLVSWGGISAFELLNPGPLPCASISDMAVGDFDGDGHPDIFCADGTNWWVSFGGNTSFMKVQASGFHVTDLRFGDFDADGTTDVFSIQSGGWQVSYAPKMSRGTWFSMWQPLPVPVSVTQFQSVAGLVVADFYGNGIADVGRPCFGSGPGWQILNIAAGAQDWSSCNNSDLLPANGAVGHFNSGRGADILMWHPYTPTALHGNPATLWVAPGGVGNAYQLSAPDIDMR